jgi:predicted nucleic acid-binding protein
LEITSCIKVILHPDGDKRILECAADDNAEYIVTGDNKPYCCIKFGAQIHQTFGYQEKTLKSMSSACWKPAFYGSIQLIQPNLYATIG